MRHVINTDRLTETASYLTEIARLRQVAQTLHDALLEACQHIPDGSIPMDVATRLTDAQKVMP